MVGQKMMVELKYVSMRHGEASVPMAGMCMMLLLYATN